MFSYIVANVYLKIEVKWWKRNLTLCVHTAPRGQRFPTGSEQAVDWVVVPTSNAALIFVHDPCTLKLTEEKSFFLFAPYQVMCLELCTVCSNSPTVYSSIQALITNTPLIRLCEGIHFHPGGYITSSKWVVQRASAVAVAGAPRTTWRLTCLPTPQLVALLPHHGRQ